MFQSPPTSIKYISVRIEQIRLKIGYTLRVAIFIPGQTVDHQNVGIQNFATKRNDVKK